MTTKIESDPLDKVFETPEESLAWYLKQMPASLIPVFQREFMRRPKTNIENSTERDIVAAKDDE